MTGIVLAAGVVVVAVTLYLYYARHLELDAAIMFALATAIILAAICFGAVYVAKLL